MKDRSLLTRRRFLRVAGAGLAVSLAGSEGNECRSAQKKPLIVDCHAHIYGEDEKKYPTIAEPYRPPKGKGTVTHLEEEMRNAGVRCVTAIQTSTFYRWDNRFTVDAAQARDNMVAVCTLDPDNPESAGILQNYVKARGVRGMRSIAAKSGRLDDPGVSKLWATAERLGIVINALTGRDKRGELESLIRRHPRLRVVIDHCLNLKAGPDMAATLKDMVALARLPTVHAKLTFIPTGSAEEYPCKDMHDACRAIIQAFEPERCVWGSDFPCELWCPGITYAQHLRIFTHELGLDEKTKRAILGETAHRLWFERLK